MTSQTYRSAYTARAPGVRALPENSRRRPPAVPRQAGPPGPACPACGAPGARWHGPLALPLCPSCTGAASPAPAGDPVRLGDLLPVMTATLVRAEHGQPLPERSKAVPSPGEGKPMTCRYCLAPGRWHTTVGGAWIPMEPDPFPAYRVPARHRWRIAPDGTAVPLGRAVPADTCRVSHFSVCPARPAPVESPELMARWRSHGGRG
ncbi:MULTISPECIES: DUF6083 domain-containing protein [Streptomyces]|uniref:DUF6083 domain-containing protein n=1 Tax=Streptomyces TaxID=1883 RepID=UPI0003C2EABE|nr:MULTISPECIES: DUF6083 domain-containing protein [unclassified Streptomyces]QPA00394.1 hypothetical protein DI273_16325 [Streptomyces violascens]UYM24438.1 DUF6083 domain-containing protein [Streptomyces albus]WDV32257.1 DUF6083 domain-containing protein [Streptomyces sp. AD16]ESQ03691.1 Hypothetical protein B590_15664 [Streptomyces sp. PVA_94-07]MBP3078735.1 hypothetical protein [Streptomyces sp. 604F]